MQSVAPRFTIVLPVRNGANFVAAAIESVLSQTYDQFELSILENGSTDDTPAIVQAYRGPRVTVYPSSQPLTMEHNWRRILDLPLAEFMTILGHDDLLYAGFLQEIVQLVKGYPEASLYQTHFDLIDEHGRHLRACKPVPIQESAEGFLQARHRGERDVFGTGYVMRSEHFRAVGGVPAFPRLIYADDALLYRLARISSKVCSLRSLFAYRWHRRSASRDVELADLYQASRLYLQALAQAGYLGSAENAARARRFVEVTFHGRSRWILVDLLAQSDRSARDRYVQDKHRILTDSKNHQQFSVSTPLTVALESLIRLPLPGFVRRATAWLIVWSADTTRGFRTGLRLARDRVSHAANAQAQGQ